LIEPRTRNALATLAGLALACTAPRPTDREVVRAYRLFGWHDCDAVRQQANAIDFSGAGAGREPFFRLLEAYCLELDGDVTSAKAL
jgi:hypothetical protein